MLRKRIISAIMAAAVSMSAMAAMSADVSAEWVKSDKGYSYKSDKTGKKLTGWQTIGEGKYYFDKNGYAAMGWKKINDTYYYFSKDKKGKMTTGWTKIGDSRYYFGTDGKMRTGFVKLSGKTYYFGTDGKMKTGKVKINGKTYDFGKDGVMKSSGSGSSSGGTSSVKLADSKMMKPMKGLRWGMSIDDVIDRKNFKNYYIQGAMLAVYDSEPFTYYMFDNNEELSAFGYIKMEDHSYAKTFRSSFKNDGWKFELSGSTDGSKYYVYSKDGQYAAVYEYPDLDMAMTFIVATSTLEDVAGGADFEDIFDI